MKLLDSLRFRVATLFRRSEMNAEIDEEILSHIQLHADDLERSGLDRAEAERRARIRFGARTRYKEECRESFAAHFFETLIRDVRFGLRMLRKSPGFGVAAVFTLAMTIAANAVAFSMLNNLVLRPVNVPGARNLYTIERGNDHGVTQSYPDYLDLRDQNRTFDGVVVYTMSRVGLDTGRNAAVSWLYEASGNYFEVLGVRPYLGRFFHASDEHGPNGSPYIVLSYAYWRGRFAGDESVVGRTIQLNKFPYTIIGVAPPAFRGTELIFSPDFWVPLVDQEQVDGSSDLNERATRGMFILGRLKNGMTPAQATADLNIVGAYLAKKYPKKDSEMSFSLARPGLLGDMFGRPVRVFLVALTLLAGLILLAACANLGSLFAARTEDRSKEIAVRLALGSSRRRILRQLLTETVLVSLVGGLAGLLGGLALLRWLSAWQPIPNIPIILPVSPDMTVCVIALALASGSGLLFGLVPVRQVLRANPHQVIKSGSVAAGRRFALRDLLLVTQIAICAVLLTLSLVAIRGLVRSLHSDFGFVPQNAMLVDTDLDMAGYSGDKVPVMQRRVLDAVAAIPGVTAAGFADRLPLSLDQSSDVVFKDATTDLSLSNAAAEPAWYDVSPGYLEAAGTSLLAGRTFTWNDDAKAPHVAVVNREFARELFGSDAGAMGGYFKAFDGARKQIVGIVEDGKYTAITEDARPAMFFPILQQPSSAMSLVIRSNRDPQQLSAAIRGTLRNLDAGLPFSIKTWNTEMGGALFPSRAAAISLGVLGALSAMLAVTGIFGMASYSVSKRLREFGIRVALGAQTKEVLRAALGRALRLLALGSVLGVLSGMAAAKLLAFAVYQATPRDPVVLPGVAITMMLLGLLATWIPARRALKVDPLTLLREE